LQGLCILAGCCLFHGPLPDLPDSLLQLLSFFVESLDRGQQQTQSRGGVLAVKLLQFGKRQVVTPLLQVPADLIAGCLCVTLSLLPLLWLVLTTFRTEPFPDPNRLLALHVQAGLASRFTAAPAVLTAVGIDETAFPAVAVDAGGWDGIGSR
jgi:hypothetical protein